MSPCEPLSATPQPGQPAPLLTPKLVRQSDYSESTTIMIVFTVSGVNEQLNAIIDCG
jgi:hypothetical protein